MTIDYSKQRLNYDAIAHLYDEPLRDHDVDRNLLLFLSERPDLEPDDLFVLDMGCGTGKQLAANRARFGKMSLVGLDLFKGMLQQGRKREPTVAWVQGDSAVPPLRTNTFHYITNQFSYPHVQQKEKMIAETYRLLRFGGRFVMRNIDPWSMPGWMIYQYFPAAQEVDDQDFLPVERFTALMEEAGFVNICVDRDHKIVEQTLHQVLEYASQRHRSSQFVAISDADYNAGVQKIKDEIRQARDEQIRIKSEVCLVTIRGDKPTL